MRKRKHRYTDDGRGYAYPIYFSEIVQIVYERHILKFVT